jgi:hypothetical protein
MESNFFLSKDSSDNEIRRYFEAILKISKQDNEFPVDLDDVWMLVYSSRNKAVRALKSAFMKDVDYQPITNNGQRSSDGRFKEGNQVDFKLSLSCLEFFIARKVRPVFEVYRKVFHKTVELAQQRQLSPSELILQLAQMNVESERKMKELEQKQNSLESKVQEIEMRTSTEIKESTVVGYAIRLGLDINRPKASQLGRVASTICSKRGYEMGKVNDPRFGYVKTYPDSVLREVFTKSYPNLNLGQL